MLFPLETLTIICLETFNPQNFCFLVGSVVKKIWVYIHTIRGVHVMRLRSVGLSKHLHATTQRFTVKFPCSVVSRGYAASRTFKSSLFCPCRVTSVSKAEISVAPSVVTLFFIYNTRQLTAALLCSHRVKNVRLELLRVMKAILRRNVLLCTVRVRRKAARDGYFNYSRYE